MTELSKEIEKCLAEYTEEVSDALDKTKGDLGKLAVAELKATSPKSKSKRSGTYAKGWTKKKRGKTIIVHNKEYQLTHLLEKGHAKVNGGRVEAKEHIKPVEEGLQEEALPIFKKHLR